MNCFKVFLLILLSVGILSCKEAKEQGGPFKSLSVEKTSKDFKIPKALKEKIEKGFIDYVHTEDPKNIDSDEKLLDKIPRKFLEVDVYLSQTDAGALAEDTLIRSPRGGGAIDLAGIVIGEKGSFYIRFNVRDPENPDGKIQNLHSYYLSGAPKREISGEIFGAGCGVTVDISKAVLSSDGNRGIRTNATEDRYFNLITGDYFFVSYSLENIYLAALHITDSSVSWPTCPN